MSVKFWKDKTFRFWDVVTVSFSHFAHDVYTSFLSPLLPLLIKKFSLTYTQAGFLNVVRIIPTVTNPVIGALVDKVGGRWLVIFAPSIAAVSMSLIGIAPTYGILIILLFVAGINSTLYHVPSPVMIKQVAGKYTGTGMSFYMVGGETARTLGPLVVLAAVSAWGLEGIWRLIPFGFFASFVLWLRLRKIKIKGHGFGKNQGELTSVRKILQSVKKFFIVMFLFLIFRAMLKTALTYYLPTFLKIQGASLWLAGASLSILEVAGIGGSMIGGWLSDHIGRRNTLLISSVFAPLLTFIFLKTGVKWAIPILVLIGLVLFTTGPVLLAYVQDLKTDRPAFINSLYMILNFLASAFASIVFGWLSDKFGMKPTFYFVSFLGFGAIPVVYLFGKVRKTDDSVLQRD